MTTPGSVYSRLVIALLLSLAVVPLDAFLVPRHVGALQSSHVASSRVVVLEAKRKRRRKASPQTKDAAPESDDDLPDFDLDDGESPKPKKASALNTDEISANMMGSADSPSRSLDELLSDRSLESKFEFDESDVDADIPDLAKIAQTQQPPVALSASEAGEPGRMTKSARNEARREAARARDATEGEGESILEKVPYFKNEKGEVKFYKILETGAWAGIFLLVAWEVYINSPLFERAAPMAPVVY